MDMDIDCNFFLFADTDLCDVGDVFRVVGLDHDLVVVGPQDGGPHADGQVRGGHHVLLKRCIISMNVGGYAIAKCIPLIWQE